MYSTFFAEIRDIPTTCWSLSLPRPPAIPWSPWDFREKGHTTKCYQISLSVVHEQSKQSDSKSLLIHSQWIHTESNFALKMFVWTIGHVSFDPRHDIWYHVFLPPPSFLSQASSFSCRCTIAETCFFLRDFFLDTEKWTWDFSFFKCCNLKRCWFNSCLRSNLKLISHKSGHSIKKEVLVQQPPYRAHIQKLCFVF